MLNEILTAQQARELTKKEVINIDKLMSRIKALAESGFFSTTYNLREVEFSEELMDKLRELGYKLDRNDYMSGDSFITINW